MSERAKIRSFKDLEVYQTAYSASLEVLKKIVPLLPQEEKFDLGEQLRRSAKAVPRLIAEGYAKRHQKKGFQKYLDDAIQESNETQVSLCHAKDVYGIAPEFCSNLMDVYDKISRQLYRLAVSWENFESRKPKPQIPDEDQTHPHNQRILVITNAKRISIIELKKVAEELFGNLVKAVVDIEKEIMVVGGELHSDEEALLIQEGSKQENLWGINIYPEIKDESWIEFDALINLRPSQGNRSRGVENPKTRERIIEIVNKLVQR